MWDHEPSLDELLEDRLAEGWRPTPSYLHEGLRVLGFAARLPESLWTGSGCRLPR